MSSITLLSRLSQHSKRANVFTVLCEGHNDKPSLPTALRITKLRQNALVLFYCKAELGLMDVSCFIAVLFFEIVCDY